jgi:serine/threonine protein kinase
MDTSLDRFYPKVFAIGKQMPESFISRVAFCVVTALDFMRGLKVMHRDIKPSNILLNANDSGGEIIKICDFGISCFTNSDVCTNLNGSRPYMPVKNKNNMISH